MGVTKMGVILRTLYGIAYWLIFLICAIVCLILVTVLPHLRWRQQAARVCASCVFILTGTRARREGFHNLPNGPCVVVANHASYLDGVLLFAVLPTGFSFVIKSEMNDVPVAGFVLRRIGQFFVERAHVQRSARAARQVMREARAGRPIGFFPEGTFTEVPGLLKFHKGAFATAKSAKLPVVPLVIEGTRGILPADRWLPHPGRITLKMLPAIDADTVQELEAIHLRDRARAAIVTELSEPDLLEA